MDDIPTSIVVNTTGEALMIGDYVEMKLPTDGWRMPSTKDVRVRLKRWIQTNLEDVPPPMLFCVLDNAAPGATMRIISSHVESLGG
jgi:hypothetical protein